MDSYRSYYTQWAESWEFQALLKARWAAGDGQLGQAFEEMIAPWVWKASTREGFVEDSRAMRRRVVAHIPRDRKSTRLNSSHVATSYAASCLETKRARSHLSTPTRC